MSFFNYVFGPKLYMEYGTKMYEPGGIEKIGDQILSTLSMMWNIGYYTSPLIVTFLYRRGYLVADSISSFAKFTTSLGVIVVISLCLRGFGRSQSRSYSKLVKAIEQTKNHKKNDDGKGACRVFDFDFKFWDVDYDAAKESGKAIVPSRTVERHSIRFATLPCDIIAYIAIHTFGIRMIYPGSIQLLQSYMRPMLITGRAKMIVEENGKRFKIKTVDKNEIDTMFIDNRSNGNNGRILVICSEGNAGFYEIGIMSTPLALKYSVLGWNHPGFEGSTGKPFPDQDKHAIEGVVQFAINKLNFPVENIILYGWSIGGFSTLWAASCYPNVKGVILDATFDDLLYLAQPRMPASVAGIVKIAIREYCNLNNSEMIPDYNGPILIIRRSEDEIIAEENQINTNRGNYLLLTLLKHRYPNIFKTAQMTRIKKILSTALESRSDNTSIDDHCMTRLVTFASEQGKVFPMQIGYNDTDEERFEMAEFLLRKHFQDYKSTHCTPLPVEFFSMPWDISIENVVS